MFRVGFYIWRYFSVAAGGTAPTENALITVMGDDEDDAMIADDGSFLEIYNNA